MPVISTSWYPRTGGNDTATCPHNQLEDTPKCDAKIYTLSTHSVSPRHRPRAPTAPTFIPHPPSSHLLFHLICRAEGRSEDIPTRAETYPLVNMSACGGAGGNLLALHPPLTTLIVQRRCITSPHPRFTHPPIPSLFMRLQI